MFDTPTMYNAEKCNGYLSYLPNLQMPEYLKFHKILDKLALAKLALKQPMLTIDTKSSLQKCTKSTHTI